MPTKKTPEELQLTNHLKQKRENDNDPVARISDYMLLAYKKYKFASEEEYIYEGDHELQNEPETVDNQVGDDDVQERESRLFKTYKQFEHTSSPLRINTSAKAGGDVEYLADIITDGNRWIATYQLLLNRVLNTIMQYPTKDIKEQVIDIFNDLELRG